MVKNLFGQPRKQESHTELPRRHELRRQREHVQELPSEDVPNEEDSVQEVTIARPESYRRQDDRKRTEVQSQTLQTQIDELRLVMRELTVRQQADQETIKRQAATIAQLNIALEKSRQEAQQSAQARALDENRTRQQIEDLETRLDDSTRPIRSLQAHVTDLLEQSRRKVDDSTQSADRYNELMTTMEHLTAMSDRTSAIAHGLRDNIDSVRGEIDELRRDIIRSDDAVKIVDQEARRRTAAVAENIEGFTARIDELRSDLAHTYDALEDTRRGLVHVDPTLDELRAGEISLRNDLSRFQSQVDERHDQLVDMQDDVRQETDARFDQLRHALEERIERLNERLEETNEIFRETTYKISEINAQIEDLRQVDASMHRDIWYLHEQRVRVRLEQVQEELDVATAQRRDAEGEARVGLGNRVRRRRPSNDSSQ
jgi:chromosome segregation ATPase